MGLFEGKVVVVTGAGGGIGRSHALAFAREGAKLVVNDVASGASGRAADEVVGELKAAGSEAVANYDSVATREGADALLYTALAAFGRVDVLINNAGILRDRSFLKMSEREWDEVIEVHLRGTFLCAQVFARQFKLQGGGGRILNTSSLAGLLGNFGQANYSAAKAGIYGLTRTLAIELAKSRVTVNAIAPLAITQMSRDLPFMQGVSEADMGPQFIAPIALFLASDGAAEITGQTLGIHGPKVFSYVMQQTEGVSRDAKEGPWSVEDLKARWPEISGS